MLSPFRLSEANVIDEFVAVIPARGLKAFFLLLRCDQRFKSCFEYIVRVPTFDHSQCLDCATPRLPDTDQKHRRAIYSQIGCLAHPLTH